MIAKVTPTYPKGGDSEQNCPRLPRKGEVETDVDDLETYDTQAAAAAPVSAGPPKKRHRPKDVPYSLGHIGGIPIPCAIARKVPKKEYINSKEAQKAMDVEWEDLRTIKRPNPKDKGKGVWDESKVLEAKDAATKARKEG